MPRAPRFVLAALLACASTTALGAVTRGPYIQNVDEDGATIAFRLDQVCEAQVRLGTQGALNRTAEGSGSGDEHFIRVEGLKPGTRYAYAVDACGADTGAKGSFETAPVPGSRSVRFAALGDMGTGGDTQEDVALAMAAAAPDFWLSLGDNAYDSGTDHEFQLRFFEPMAELLAHSALFPSIGNHEYLTLEGAPYLAAFETPANNPQGKEQYYSFDWGMVHFVALDTNRDVPTQAAWLKQDLAASDAPWTVVFAHHPFYSSGDHGSTSWVEDLIPIMEEGGVDLVLTGHDHDYERTHPMKGGQVVPAGTPGAITYLVVGTGGATNRPFDGSAPAFTAFRSDSAYGYLDVSVEGGTLEAKLVDPDGQVLDQFTIAEPVPPPTLKVVAEPAQGQAPMTVGFTALPEPADAVVEWDFGDGERTTGQTVSHAFAAPGTYVVTTVATAGGESASVQTKIVASASGIEVTPPPSGQVPPEEGGPPAGGEAPGPDPQVAEGGGCTTAGLADLAAPLVVIAGLVAFRLARRRQRRDPVQPERRPEGP